MAPYAGTWIQRVTDGINGLSKEEWERVDEDPTREDTRQRARFRFVVQILAYSANPRQSSAPDLIVDEMNKLGGPFVSLTLIRQFSALDFFSD